jgi:hypothetical protein
MIYEINLGDFDKAREHYVRAIEIFPGIAVYHADMASLLRRRYARIDDSLPDNFFTFKLQIQRLRGRGQASAFRICFGTLQLLTEREPAVGYVARRLRH